MESLIEELKKIIEMEGITSKDGVEARRTALDSFIKRHVQEIVVESKIIKNDLSSDEQDYLKYYMGSKVAEKIIEDSALVESDGKKIRISILLMGNSFPRNKK